MRTRLVIPLDAYKVLRSACNEGCPEHPLLRTGVILRTNGAEYVNLYCNHSEAQSLIEFAWRNAREAASHIKLVFEH